MPQRQTKLHPAAQLVDLALRAGRFVGALEIIDEFGSEVFIVPVFKNGFKNVSNFVHLRTMLLWKCWAWPNCLATFVKACNYYQRTATVKVLQRIFMGVEP